MIIAEQITELFCSEYTLIEIIENNSYFSCKYDISNPYKPNNIELETALALIPGRDSVNIIFRVDSSEDSVLNNSEKESIDIFLSGLEAKLSIRDETDKYSLDIVINKSRKFGEISVYSLTDFVKFWSEGGIPSSFKKIQELASDVQILRVYELNKDVKTNCFLFTTFNSDVQFEKQIERSELHTKRDKVGHFANASQFNFIPEDFNFDILPDVISLVDLFKKLKLISSLVYICDFSRFSDDSGIHLRLNGYRLFSKNISVSNEIKSKSEDEYYEIYKWVFGEGNIVDKVGVSRNIISLHLVQDNLLNIQEKTLQSIGSGYQIYLKENVKQYIEIKNKLSEFIQNSSDKASEIVKSISGYYKSSIWTMYSFFASVFLLRILSKNNDGVLVTEEVYYLFIAFSIINIIIMKYALKELDEEKDRFIENYLALKDRYNDLLLPEDLLNVLNNDKQHRSDVKYIENKKKSFCTLWDRSLSVIFFIISLLWYIGR
ncbi:MAG: hypothetical protein GQ532_12890 [Methylomarinum sp.]|nr:hypothetical protein [Methylomarinum sp.]